MSYKKMFESVKHKAFFCTACSYLETYTNVPTLLIDNVQKYNFIKLQ